MESTPQPVELIEELEVGILQLKHPSDGTPLQIFLTLAGPGNETRRQRELRQKRENLRRIQKAGKLVFEDPEDEEIAEIEYLVACTLGWDGADLPRIGIAEPYSVAAARKLYSTKTPFRWVGRQVAAALRDQGVFIKSSSKS